MRIGIDAMGGDFAPEVVVKGAVMALNQLAKDSTIVLFGDEEAIHTLLTEEGCTSPRIEIVATEGVIEMGDHPVTAFRQKSNSSIAVGFRHLAKGDIDSFASAGSTGAMMVGANQLSNSNEEIIRPTIATVIPTITGSQVVLLDIGLNVDCKPAVLCQYGALGSKYAEEHLGISNPRVALLNIGNESSKGNNQSRSAFRLMSASREAGEYNFVGNIEASHLLTSQIADVVVCDGFVGNVILKLMEGFYAINHKMGITNDFWEEMNYEARGGTPVLGVDKPIIIGHGKSTPTAICNMILLTEQQCIKKISR